MNHLQTLYTVVVALAMEQALQSVVRLEQPYLVEASLLPYLIAFVVTLVPFYHGGLRHLDLSYIKEGHPIPKSGSMIADWTLLFLQSCLFLALAIAVKDPTAFTKLLAVILGFDVVWALLAHFVFTPNRGEDFAEKKWAIINTPTVVLLVLIVVVIEPSSVWSGLVLAICILRTAIDYWWGWDFYDPVRERRTSVRVIDDKQTTAQ
ncbi:hypothetical protein ACFLRO_00445 [Bacteroidota bacterium]